MKRLILYAFLVVGFGLGVAAPALSAEEKTAVLGHAAIQDPSRTPRSEQERVVRTDNAELFCRTFGSGQPLIVLHGGPGLTQDYLLPNMSKLAQNHLIIFYDQRGCGRSTGQITSETINIETFVNDLDAVRQAFHLDKVSILGHSWGGFLAMEYAIAHPEHVDKLILSNSMPASSPELALFIQEWTLRMAPFQETLADIHKTSAFEEGDPATIERLHRIIFRTYCHVPEKAELLSLRVPAKASVNGAKVYGFIRENVFQKHFDLHDSLKKLKIPTLVLHGDADPIPPSTAHHIHQSVPGSRYVLMKNCGHFPYVEDPEAFFKYLSEFLDGKNS
jgi:proline iminopeptidase